MVGVGGAWPGAQGGGVSVGADTSLTDEGVKGAVGAVGGGVPGALACPSSLDTPSSLLGPRLAE